jgi:hypothetical protein
MMIGPWLPAGFAVIGGLVAFVVADAPVSRERLARFASRHGLTVTADNAPHVVRYLALTCRWRVAGVVVGLTAHTVAGFQRQSLSVSILYGLVGWFVGAIVAEIRATPPAAVRRAASLEPRSVNRYVTPAARTALVVTTGLCLVAVALTFDNPRVWVRPLIAAIVLPVLVLAVVRRIAVRAQPISSPDIIAADEAIRRSSSQALYAAAVTLLLYASVGPLLWATVRDSVNVAFALTLLSLPAIPAIGWRLGRIRLAR